MLTKYEPVCYELLRPGQVKEIRDKCPIVYMPAGALEWHGVQNPLGTDALKAHAICCEAALKYGGIVLPPFYLGLHAEGCWGPEGWTGYTLGCNQETMLEGAMRGAVKALISGGWKVIVGVTGHDVREQRDAIQRAIEAETDGMDAAGFAVFEGQLHQRNDAIPYVMDHAGAWETSCMMYAYPDKVDLDTLRERGISADDILKISGSEGIDGENPLKYATRELGANIVKTMGELIGARAEAVLADLMNK